MDDKYLKIETTIAVRGLRLHAKAASYDTITLSPEMQVLRPLRPNEVLVEIHAAAVNPSDAKAATGLMPYAVFPRTPGRDFAGRIIVGPQQLVGKLASDTQLEELLKQVENMSPQEVEALLGEVKDQ